MQNYDLAVLGSGPAGHFGAIQGAKAGKKVVVIEDLPRVGGSSATLGTIPSKSLREATIHLTGLNQQSFYGMSYRVKANITVQDLTARTEQIIRNETAVFEDQLRRNGVKIVHGRGSFTGPQQLVVENEDGMQVVRAQKFLIATGSCPAHPPRLAFDGEKICDSNQILTIRTLPKRLIVVGAGVIGMEYACIFAALGVRVVVINHSPTFMEFVDAQILDLLKYHMQNRNVEFRLGEEVVDLERRDEVVVARTSCNKEIVGDCLLYTVGRRGNTDLLNLEEIGIPCDDRGRVKVDAQFRTAVPHIYAAGDVIGFPALAATSREQGRRAVCYAFDIPIEAERAKMPLGIYTIPEISMIGPTETELSKQKTPYEVGVARYREIARGQIAGDTTGMLKILFQRENLRILAVHIIGEGATELVHIGQGVEAFGGTIEYFANAVFNYPTLAECYKVAALDGMNRVRIGRGSKSKLQAAPAAQPEATP
ncbi:MAG: Si-specific NAD(P)(+) transhydrogenase [Planctomycetes bacterium]|nr:Si-specific NAD(P)(+) transhydrogenase [Planctomycetota bacterium]